MSSFCSVLPQMQPNQTPLGHVGRKTVPSIGISDQNTPHGLAGHLQPRTRIAAQRQQAMRKKQKAKKRKVVEKGSNLVKLRCSRTLHLLAPKRSLCATRALGPTAEEAKAYRASRPVARHHP